MRVFNMETIEGPTIPILMFSESVTQTEIENAFSNFSSIPGHSKRFGYIFPAYTQEYLDATDEELWSFAINNNILKIIYETPGRKLTLKNEVGGEQYTLSMSNSEGLVPFYIQDQDRYILTNEEGPYPDPWGTANSTSLLIGNSGITEISDESDVWSAMGSYSDAPRNSGYSYEWRPNSIFDTGNATPLGCVPILIMDHNGVVHRGSLGSVNRTGPAGIPAGDIKKIMLKVHLNIQYPASGNMNWNLNLYSFPDSVWTSQEGDVEVVRPTPIPDPEIEPGIFDIAGRYSPRVATSAIGIYPLSASQVSEFARDLWTTTLVEFFLEAIGGKPIDSVLALRYYYGLNDYIQRTTKESYLCVGNSVFDGSWESQSGAIITRPARSEYVQVQMGDVEIVPRFNNFLDYSPYTKIDLFIPFYGFVNLDATEFMGSKIRIVYNIDIVVGSTVINVYRKKGDGEWASSIKVAAQIGKDIPLTIQSMESTGLIFSQVSAGAVAAGVGMAQPAAAMMAAGASAASMDTTNSSNFQNALMNQTSSINQERSSFSRSGSLTGDASSLDEFTPYLLYTRPVVAAPNDYNRKVGRPDFSSGSVGSFNGYIKVGSLDTSAVNIPHDALSEIVSLLKGGVYID